MKPKIYMLDNFDSFTYNLVDAFRAMQYEVVIYRNNLPAALIAERMAAESQPVILVISPGPGAPHEAGCTLALLALVAGQVPVLGICLGHQAIVEHFGGRVGASPEIMHGRTSLMQHQGQGLFAGLENPLTIARYHSLAALKLPDCLQPLADVNGIVMAVTHRSLPVVGFQFHPESIMTGQGEALLRQTFEYLLSAASGSSTGLDINSDNK